MDQETRELVGWTAEPEVTELIRLPSEDWQYAAGASTVLMTSRDRGRDDGLEDAIVLHDVTDPRRPLTRPKARWR